MRRCVHTRPPAPHNEMPISEGLSRLLLPLQRIHNDGSGLNFDVAQRDDGRGYYYIILGYFDGCYFSIHSM